MRSIAPPSYRCARPCNTATGTFPVSVVDTTAPLASINGSSPMTVECHSAFTDPGASASDDCDAAPGLVTSGTVLTNVVGSANLIRAAKDYKSDRFIYFQTALCYGLKPLQQPVRLDHPKLPANSSYAISKTAAEDYLEISGLDHVTFRLANVIGPRNVSGPLPIFFQRLTEGRRCFVTSARRDFVYVHDVARACVLALETSHSHDVFNVGSGVDRTILSVAHDLARVMGRPSLIPSVTGGVHEERTDNWVWHLTGRPSLLSKHLM